MTQAQELSRIAKELSEAVGALVFELPVAVVYNPLVYAWRGYSRYVEIHGNSRKRVIFLGMNPGPWGMAQTGVPFGEVNLVREWLGIEEPVEKPVPEHPKHPVEGFGCRRSEVSGRRLWGLFQERFGEAERFFEQHFVANYCPLVFMEAGGKNRTPDRLKPGERERLFEYCDLHLRQMVEILAPEWLIGVGAFAAMRARVALKGLAVQVGTILHPSPASPAANVDWPGTVTRQLQEMHLWD